ncbi:hypothetical protein AHAS_Ahas13G0125000 [Arachis hypogaea]
MMLVLFKMQLQDQDKKKKDAITRPNSEYSILVRYIGLYKCERYHLSDFKRSSEFANGNEIFSYYQSSLRCIIERTFRVWKNRFVILRPMPKFKMKTQIQIVSATMTIHNFIRRNSKTDFEFTQYEDENIIEDEDDNQIGDSQSPNLSVAFSSEMNIVRDSIQDQILVHRSNLIK